MENSVKELYGQFDQRRKAFDAKEADEQDLLMLESIESKIPDFCHWV